MNNVDGLVRAVKPKGEGVMERRRTAEGSTEEPRVKSTDRTLEILEILASSKSRHTLGELAGSLHIPKSSLHAILATMLARGWIETDSSGKRFGLGVRALLVGTSYVDSDDIVVAASEELDRLSERLGETIHLGRLDGTDIVYLAKRESPHPLRLFSAIGRRLAAHATALGKALLAERTEDELGALLPPELPPLTRRTIVDPEELWRELEKTRTRGWARDDQESTEGLRCLAVAVGPMRPRQNAISCSVPVVRLSRRRESEIVDQLKEARDRIDARLGARLAGYPG
jgi:DNA-binding IclR family transcriptional regulator